MTDGELAEGTEVWGSREGWTPARPDCLIARPGPEFWESPKSSCLLDRIVQHGFEEAVAVGAGGGELQFQLVAEGHQFIDFGDDAMLFFYG